MDGRLDNAIMGAAIMLAVLIVKLIIKSLGGQHAKSQEDTDPNHQDA